MVMNYMPLKKTHENLNQGQRHLIQLIRGIVGVLWVCSRGSEGTLFVRESHLRCVLQSVRVLMSRYGPFSL